MDKEIVILIDSALFCGRTLGGSIHTGLPNFKGAGSIVMACAWPRKGLFALGARKQPCSAIPSAPPASSA